MNFRSLMHSKCIFTIFENCLKIEEILIHPNFNSPQLNENRRDHDFCLLKMEKMPLDGQTSDIACLPEFNKHIHPNVWAFISSTF